MIVTERQYRFPCVKSGDKQEYTTDPNEYADAWSKPGNKFAKIMSS